MSVTTRRRTTTAVVLSALLGGALGISGASFALWNDTAEVGGAISAGHEYFAVGRPGATVPAPTGTIDITVGAAEATELLREGEVAVPIQVDSLSQGNKGLRYELTPPSDWGQGVFAAAEARHLFPVEDPARCSTELLPDGPPPGQGPFVSTPVSALYSTETVPTTEYWCLYASLDGLPEHGTYTNTARVTAQSEAGHGVSDEHSWHGLVVADLDPSDEPDHVLTVTSTTFRPQEQP